MKNNLFPIAKEGWSYLGYTLVLFFFSLLFEFEILSFIFFIAIVFFAYIFRNPELESKVFEESTVLSPIDGIVTSIETLEDPLYLHKIIIESTYSDISILRMPLHAKKIFHVKYSGTRLQLKNRLAQKLNESLLVEFEDEDGNKIKILHRTQGSFFGICSNITDGSSVYKSSRYGAMTNGTTAIYLPKNFTVAAKKEDGVKTSDSLLATFS